MNTISDILQHKGKEVISIDADASVYSAIEVFAQRRIGALLVSSADNPMAGLVSERDYTCKVTLKDRDAKNTTVREIMTGDLITVQSATTIDECMSLMSEHKIRHLPVVDEQQLQGMISIGDVVKAQLQSKQQEISQLQNYIHGSLDQVE